MIDRQLTEAGWLVQDKSALNLFAAPGVVVRESIMATGHGRVDYLLYVDQRVIGVIEAKPVGTALSGVEWQSAMYATGLPPAVRLRALSRDDRLPFVFEASGTETHVSARVNTPANQSNQISPTCANQPCTATLPQAAAS